MTQLSDQIVAWRPLVVLIGPTAVGKSDIAIAIARALDTEVLTADSRQVYRGMNIATDKPSRAQQQGVPHRLIDLVEPDQPFNTGMYREQALVEIDRLYAEHRLPLVVGGTGLYVRTLVRGLCDAPQARPDFRDRLLGEARLREKGYLHQELSRVDPESAQRLHPNDEIKIVRALEVHHVSGKRLSDLQREHRFAGKSFTPLLLGLNRDRDALYGRIEQRVDTFFTNGLVDETRTLLAQGYHRELGSMKGLGYRQVAAYLVGECSYAEAVHRLKRDTRRFAKRQLTWFRKEPGIRWVALDDQDTPASAANRLLVHINGFLADLRERSPVWTVNSQHDSETAVG